GEASPCSWTPRSLHEGISAALEPSKVYTPLQLRHPHVLAAVADARVSSATMPALVSPPENAPDQLLQLAGKRGRLRVIKVSFDGFERIELLVPIFMLGSGEIIPQPLADMRLHGTMRDAAAPLIPAVSDGALPE